MYKFKAIYKLINKTHYLFVEATNFNDAYDIARARINQETDGCGEYVSIDVVERIA
jgi:hypothetical protein